ncbi:MAG: flagellar biosynthesis protein FliQ [Bradymonadia bacterium]
MTIDYVVGFFYEALKVAAQLSMPALLLGLSVGLMVSIFQAVTQINEQTLTLIPKIVAIVTGLMVFGHWMLQRLITFAGDVIGNLHTLPG